VEGAVKIIATAPFYITGRLLNRERGETSYIVELINAGEKEILYVKTTGGAKSIARAVEGAGVFLRGRAVEEYIIEYLSINWSNMQVNEKVEENDLGIEFESVYEQLIEYVLENEEKFEEQLWGRFSESWKEVYIRILLMDGFLNKMGITNKRKTLTYWKNKGILQNGDSRHLTRSVRIGGRIQRAYVIAWPKENPGNDNGEGKEKVTSHGIKTGDIIQLVEKNTGEKLEVQIVGNEVRTENYKESMISENSPMGKSLLGKVAGDMVNVVVEGKVVGEYKVVKS
jgi:hypothetical protein